MIILKEFNENLSMDVAKTKMVLENYAEKLEKEGWICSISEGGFISPDSSTLFVTDRCPYYGQLLCYDVQNEKAFKEYANNQVMAGIFIKK